MFDVWGEAATASQLRALTRSVLIYRGDLARVKWQGVLPNALEMGSFPGHHSLQSGGDVESSSVQGCKCPEGVPTHALVWQNNGQRLGSWKQLVGAMGCQQNGAIPGWGTLGWARTLSCLLLSE